MGEPHFVSCESTVLSNTEESPKFEFCASNFVEVKVEPDDGPQDPGVKEETESPDVNKQDQIVSEQYGNHNQPSSSASQSTCPEKTGACSTGTFRTDTHLEEHVSAEGTKTPASFHFKSCGDDEGSEFFSCHQEFSECSNDDEQLHVCKLCGEVFAEQSVLQMHNLKHTANRSFECTFCGKIYSRKFDLQRHILSHTGEKRYECTLCSKAYSRKALLQTHILTHTGEKPHVCTYCNKAFTQLGHLQTHVLTHTGQKPHTCVTCGKGFCRRSALKMHVLTHTKTKAFYCTLCGKAFSVRFSLRRHISMMHTVSESS